MPFPLLPLLAAAGSRVGAALVGRAATAAVARTSTPKVIEGTMGNVRQISAALEGTGQGAAPAMAGGKGWSSTIPSPPPPGTLTGSGGGPAQQATGRVRGWYEQARMRAERIQQLRTPVSEQVQGMSPQERYERQKQQGSLLDTQEVARRVMKDTPNIQDIVRESERQEERSRQAELEKEQKGAGGMGQVGYNILQSVGAALTPAKLMLLPIALYGFARALNSVTRSSLESNRQLGRWNIGVQTAYASLDWHDLQMQRQRAGTRAGAIQYAEAGYEFFDKAIQPYQSALGNLWDFGLGTLSYAGGIAAKGAEYTPLGQLVEAINKFSESLDKAAEPQGALLDAWGNLARKKQPVNQRPDAADGGKNQGVDWAGIGMGAAWAAARGALPGF